MRRWGIEKSQIILGGVVEDTSGLSSGRVESTREF